MNSKQPTPGASLARLSIWTLVHHDWLAAQIRFYVWSASATVLFFSIASIIPLQIALTILLFCGLGMLIVLWSLIQWRKSIILAIRDEELKRLAHAAMLALIHSRQIGGPTIVHRKGPIRRWVKKRYHS